MTLQQITEPSHAGKKKRWTPEEVQYLKENLHILPMSDLARTLGRTERAVKLFIHFNREKVDAFHQEERNILREILIRKFGRLEHFKTTREFYETVKIGQVRFGQIYRGEKKPTEREYRSLVNYFELDPKEIFESRQYRLFEGK